MIIEVLIGAFAGAFTTWAKMREDDERVIRFLLRFFAQAPREIRSIVLAYFDFPSLLVLVEQAQGRDARVQIYDHFSSRPVARGGLRIGSGSLLIAEGWLYEVSASACTRVRVNPPTFETQEFPPSGVSCAALLVRRGKLLALTCQVPRFDQPRGLLCLNELDLASSTWTPFSSAADFPLGWFFSGRWLETSKGLAVSLTGSGGEQMTFVIDTHARTLEQRAVNEAQCRELSSFDSRPAFFGAIRPCPVTADERWWLALRLRDTKGSCLCGNYGPAGWDSCVALVC